MRSKWFSVGIVALGVAAVWFAVQSQRQPTPIETVPYAPVVNVVLVEQQQVAPQAIGYGVVAAQQGWQMVAQVAGEVVFKHPNLQAGFQLEQGEKVLQIDEIDYQLRFEQAKAQVIEYRAELDRKQQQKINLQTSVQLEQQHLTLLQKEVQRRQRLQSKGMGTDADLDTQRRAVLTQQVALSALKQELALWPSDVAKIEAQLANAQAEVQLAQREQEKTGWQLTQSVYVEEVSVELGQWVNVGQVLASGYQIGEMTLPVMISERDWSVLMTQGGFGNGSAKVSWQQGAYTKQLDARIRSVGQGVDSTTSMVTVTLEVLPSQGLKSDEAYSIPNKGQMVKAHIIGQASAQMVIPASALHGDKVYRLNADNQVEFVPVTPLFFLEGKVAIESRLRRGDRLIAQDVLPMVEGMRVRPEGESL